MSHNSTAKRVREDKLNHPHKFCPACLWKTMDGSYCPRHKPVAIKPGTMASIVFPGKTHFNIKFEGE
jgi:hypothetical protein